MAVAVVIPTCNRSKSLEAMLESIFAGTVVPDELIVVDQSTNTETRELVASLQARAQYLQYVQDPASGSSHAKNIGWKLAKSDLIAFTDDDATVDRFWLAGLIDASRLFSTVGVVGGRIIIPNLYEYSRIVFPPDKQYLLPSLDLGESAVVFPQASYPVGVNMLTKRALLERLGGFNEDLGPNYGRRFTVSGEETDFCQRIQALGLCLVYTGRAIVAHPLLQERNTVAFFRRRLAFELYTKAVFNWSLESRLEYVIAFLKQVKWLLSVLVQKIPRSDLEKFLLRTELKSRIVAVFLAPRSRSRRLLPKEPELETNY